MEFSEFDSRVNNAILRDSEAVEYLLQHYEDLCDIIKGASDTSAIEKVLHLVPQTEKELYYRALCENRNVPFTFKQPYVDALLSGKSEAEILYDIKWEDFPVRDAIAAHLFTKGPVPENIYTAAMNCVGRGRHLFEVIVGDAVNTGDTSNPNIYYPYLANRNKNLSFEQFYKFFDEAISESISISSSSTYLYRLAANLNLLAIDDDIKYAAFCLAVMTGPNYAGCLSTIEYGRDDDGNRSLNGAISVYISARFALNEVTKEFEEFGFDDAYITSQSTPILDNLEAFGRNVLRYHTVADLLQCMPTQSQGLITLTPQGQLHFADSPDATRDIKGWFDSLHTDINKLILADTILSCVETAPESYKDVLKALCEDVIKEWEPNAQNLADNSEFINAILSEGWGTLHDMLEMEEEPAQE